MGPFQDYLPVLYCPGAGLVGQDHHCQRDYLTVPTIFTPHVEILPSKDKAGISASTDLASRTLYDALDLLEFGRKPEAATEGTYQNIRGMIGERILSLLMEHFLLSFRDLPGYEISGILRERDRHLGKGFVVHFNDRYLLKYSGRFSLVLLTKIESTGPEAYQQEKSGLIASEIDGMGFLHTRDARYLVVGESTTKSRFEINNWDDQSHGGVSIEDRLFRPLKSLFPNHQLLYFVVATASVLFDRSLNPPRLKNPPQNVYRRLQKEGIGTVFVPLPTTKPTVDEIVVGMMEKIPVSRAIAIRAYGT